MHKAGNDAIYEYSIKGVNLESAKGTTVCMAYESGKSNESRHPRMRVESLHATSMTTLSNTNELNGKHLQIAKADLDT
jgi:hypothetical protein